MGLQSLHVGWLWLIVSGFCSCTAFWVALTQDWGGYFLLLCAKIVNFLCAFVSQPVEDQGVHIPDQTVIKKGKQFPPRYHACFCKMYPPTHTHARTHAIRHSAPENSMQCGNAWLILIRSSLFFITWFPCASNWLHLFHHWWNLLSAFRGSGEMSGGGWWALLWKPVVLMVRESGLWTILKLQSPCMVMLKNGSSCRRMEQRPSVWKEVVCHLRPWDNTILIFWLFAVGEKHQTAVRF